MHPCQLAAVRIGGAAGNSGGVTFNEGRFHIIGSADKHAVKDRRRAMPVYQQLQLVPRLDFQTRPKPVPLPQGTKQKAEGNIPGITGRYVLLFQAIYGNIPSAPFPAVQQGLQNFFWAPPPVRLLTKNTILFFIFPPPPANVPPPGRQSHRPPAGLPTPPFPAIPHTIPCRTRSPPGHGPEPRRHYPP